MDVSGTLGTLGVVSSNRVSVTSCATGIKCRPASQLLGTSPLVNWYHNNNKKLKPRVRWVSLRIAFF